MQGVMLVGPVARLPQMSALSEHLAGHGLPGAVVACDSAGELSATLKERPVHILVIHVEMAERVGKDGLARLRAESPGIDWVLAWPRRVPNLVELAVCTRARGGLDLTEPAHAYKALQQVAAGQFWLPRWMLHDLYVALLDERRVLALGVVPTREEGGPMLTRREAAVLALLHEGCTNREIGARLGISVSTVKKHLTNAFEKRGLHSRRQALA